MEDAPASRKGCANHPQRIAPFPKHLQAFGEDGKATQEYKDYRKKLQTLAKKKFGGTEVENHLRIAISNKGLKEFINQPHKEAQAKNEVVRYLPQFIRECKYTGFTSDYKKRTAVTKIRVFEAKIKDVDSFVLAREYADGKCQLYSITDEREKIKGGLQKISP